MRVVSEAEEHLISVEDETTGALYHFAAGRTRGLRFIGGEPAKPIDPAPDEKSSGYAAAEAAAIGYARDKGWF